ncbi:MAG: Unknown protein, partial [uncultured Thiotrichaceae bacterium]
ERHEEVLVEPIPDPLLVMLERIKKGEEAALEALYNATVSRVYGLAVKIVNNPELAEEVVGDVFLQVWRKARDFDAERAVPLAWLLMICRSRALDKLRREKRITKNQCQHYENAEPEAMNVKSPLETASCHEMSGYVREALLQLNDQQHQLIILAFYKGMSHQEISDYTGNPLGTVKSGIRRAQILLRQIMSREDCKKGEAYG